MPLWAVSGSYFQKPEKWVLALSSTHMGCASLGLKKKKYSMLVKNDKEYFIWDYCNRGEQFNSTPQKEKAGCAMGKVLENIRRLVEMIRAPVFAVCFLRKLGTYSPPPETWDRTPVFFDHYISKGCLWGLRERPFCFIKLTRVGRFTSQRGREIIYDCKFSKINTLRRKRPEGETFLKFSQADGSEY